MQIRSTCNALQEAGSEVEYYSCDVTDEDATASALRAVRAKWGPITGFVHAAGVIADKRLSEKTAEDFRRVFGTKINGLRSLLAATQDDPLSLICLFSSVAARAGNAGQADYAMANEVLNRVAQAEAKQRRDSGCVVKSIGWGPWESGMVTPSLRAKVPRVGRPADFSGSGGKELRCRDPAGFSQRSRGFDRRAAPTGASYQSDRDPAGAAISYTMLQ